MKRPTCLALTLGLFTASTVARAQSSIDGPMATAWPAARAWDAGEERAFGEFVGALGRGIAARRCHTLAQCLDDPRVNPLHVAGTRALHFRADCADVPYTLRAYFAWRRQLPFAWTHGMRGHGRDARYLAGAHPAAHYTWTQFPTPRALIESIGHEVHSGYLRTAPDLDDADFYQATIDRTSIHPGTVYYDPNGHVLIVYEVRPDGDVLLFDGHPGNSLSHPHFSDRYPLGTARMGGGFKNFRPLVWRGEERTVAFSPNARISDWSGASPFDRTQYLSRGFHAWVAGRLNVTSGPAHDTHRIVSHPSRVTSTATVATR